MRQYNNILAIIEPKKEKQLALQRAIELARFNPKVKITALRLIYDLSNEIHFLSKKNEMDTQKEVETLHSQDLDNVIEQTRASISDFDTSKVSITPKVVSVRDVAEGMLQETNSGYYDLIIKGANNHGIFGSIIFTPHDWNLLRNANIPVVIAKEHGWGSDGAIVVAVDFTTQEKQAMDILLLREAQMLSTITKSPIHLVNSAPVVLPTVMLEVPNYAPELYAESILAEHKRRIVEFAKLHNIPESNCHIAEGMPDDVIPRICRKLNANTVFIGTTGRSGINGALVGNTCEEIVDYIDADLFVLNRTTLNHERSVAFKQE